MITDVAQNQAFWGTPDRQRSASRGLHRRRCYSPPRTCPGLHRSHWRGVLRHGAQSRSVVQPGGAPRSAGLSELGSGLRRRAFPSTALAVAITSTRRGRPATAGLTFHARRQSGHEPAPQPAARSRRSGGGPSSGPHGITLATGQGLGCGMRPLQDFRLSSNHR
jgi:hypothetical protein